MPRGRRRNTGDVFVRSAELIGWALGGLEREIGQTKSRLAELSERAAQLRKQAARAGGQAMQDAGQAIAGSARRPRRMSAAGRKRIAEAAKRRWAKWRAEKKNR